MSAPKPAAEPSWDLYGTFLAVMQGRSLSAAARQLGLAQPTARRQIEALEEALGVVLFTRASNGLVPTEAAEACLPYATSMAATAQALVRSASAPAGEAAGTVRLAASEMMGTFVLPSMLASLVTASPRLQLELSLSNKNEDLLRREADVAVRMVAPTQTALVARRAGTIPLGLFADGGYLAARGIPLRPADLLRGHVLIGGDRDRSIIGVLRGLGLEATPRHFALRTDSDVAQLTALIAGIGIGVCQLPLAARHPDLQRVLPSISFGLESWVVMHEDLRASARVRVVFDHLVREIGAYCASGAEKHAPRKTPARRKTARR